MMASLRIQDCHLQPPIGLGVGGAWVCTSLPETRASCVHCTCVGRGGDLGWHVRTRYSKGPIRGAHHVHGTPEDVNYGRLGVTLCHNQRQRLPRRSIRDRWRLCDPVDERRVLQHSLSTWHLELRRLVRGYYC